MQNADGEAPIEGARQPDLDDDEHVKYIKHGVSVFVDERCVARLFIFLPFLCQLVTASVYVRGGIFMYA